MTAWYNAQESIVEAANSATAEAAGADDGGSPDRLRRVWQPIADALLESAPENFARDWPDLSAQAEEAGADFVGVTSDTRKVVVWGDTKVRYREFAILDRL